MIFTSVTQALLYLALIGEPPCSSDWHYCEGPSTPYVTGVITREHEDRTGVSVADAPAVSEPETDAPGRCEVR
jgi:hypothetical protein